jgi:leucyl/phenylalanyl-tRNA--protein transferase
MEESERGTTFPFTPELVLEAYRHGIFPMGEEGSDQIYWFQPDPRAIIPLDRFHVARSLQKLLRKGVFAVTYDQAFAKVMRGCAEHRPVWISESMHVLYNALHRRGHAHSVEVWRGEKLVGGLYGVQLGSAFMAESMFYRESNASKVALVKLVERLRQRHFELLEVQYLTQHLVRFGAVEISLETYLRRLWVATEKRCRFD